jgi:hypothetical protein
MYKTNWHIFGGYGDSTLQTSQIVNENVVVVDGTVLPTAVSHHAITSINKTVSILSGGDIADDASSQTFYYNHITKIFTSSPTLLEGRRRHGSATIVDKSTKAKIPVVTGGANYNWDTMDSTELLINGHWQKGTI